MPFVMSLEGPRVAPRPVPVFRTRMTSNKPTAQFYGLFDPFVANPWIVILGLIGGAWWAIQDRKKP